jgi:hypothetical protein
MTTWNLEDVRSCADECTRKANQIQEILSDNIADLSPGQINSLIDSKVTLGDHALELRAKAIDLAVADLADPQKRIKQSIELMDSAIKELKCIKAGVNMFAAFVTFIGTVLGAIATGGGVLPVAGGILGALDSFSQATKVPC